MHQVAFILENTTVYWYSIVLALSVCAGICFFMACCRHSGVSSVFSAGAAVLAVGLSLLISRLLYWNCRADSFGSLSQALMASSSVSFALGGAFLGCGLTALLLGRASGGVFRLLDCMSVAGCGAIALGRLGNFFTSADRGLILTEMTGLPWAYPVVNAASGLPEYRLATFLFQAVIAGVLFLVLVWLFCRADLPHGDVSMLFIMVYCASQVILDSTRYDSLYLRSNGFVSMVQILAAVGLAVTVVLAAVRAVKADGLKKWMVPVWVVLAGLFGCAGYMEYFVQRHGRLAFFAYSVMEHCLVGIVVLSITLWRHSRSEE